MELLEELDNLLKRLDEEGIDYALCGGLAMAVYAFPRATLDIDIMIKPASLEALKALAADLGYTVDAGLMRFREGAIQMYRVTKIPEGSDEALALDLLLATPAVQDVWEGRRKMEWDKGMLSVVSPEGLIALKSMRQSGQDQDDIEKLRSIIDEN
jgi:hypothetical protein